MTSRQGPKGLFAGSEDKSMIKLYDYELSGNCYKVRLMLKLLNLEFELQPVDFYPGREHKTASFKRINPLGELPVIEDDGVLLRDAQAILVYLASKYDRDGSWYSGGGPVQLGEISAWLSFADRITATASMARLHDGFLYDLDVDRHRAAAHALFRVLDEHLWFAEQEAAAWICSESSPTIADIACFPFVMLSDEGGISRLPYPSIRRWTDRVKRIPNFIPMPGIFNA